MMMLTLAASARIALCLNIKASFSPKTTGFMKFPIPSDLYYSLKAITKFRIYFFILGLLSDNKLAMILQIMLLLKLNLLL